MLIIFASNVVIFTNFNNYQDNNSINAYKGKEIDKTPLNSNLNDAISGIGDNQSVRIYINNQSENINDNMNYFNISTNPSQDMYLNYGAFNFTFQNNYTTDYILEDDSAFNATSFISFDSYPNSYTNITILKNGTERFGDNYSAFFDGLNSTALYVNATEGLLNFTVRANFTDIDYSIQDYGNVEFNRSNILVLILSMVFNLTSDANLTVRIKDNSTFTWKEIISTVEINNNSGDIQEVGEKFINKNLNFTDVNNCSYIEFVFKRWDNESFLASLYNFNLDSTYAFDLPITDTSYVALEFDLKGLNSTVNGFSAWIRTLNVSEAINTRLNITLYRANSTIKREDAYLGVNSLMPDNNTMIDTKLWNYTADELSYFTFDINNATNLNVSNYFIVIKSNNSKEVYSLVTLPYSTYGDINVSNDHQLKTTQDEGGTWINAIKKINTNDTTYSSGQLDASSFRLNVTRGYMVSDFSVNGTDTLKIQNISINPLVISSFPYNESSYLTWGKGQWNHNFITPIEDSPTNNFQINLTWDKVNSSIQGFKFNVTYSVNAYWVENATAAYSAVYDEDPEWVLNYTLVKNNTKFDNWSLIELWMLFPNYMTPYSLTNPNLVDILSQIDNKSIFDEAPSYDKIIINDTIANLNGSYLLNLKSFNFIQDMNSYINFNGNLWETSGFMYWDNISISVNIQGQNLKAPVYGNATVTLFTPSGIEFINATLSNSTGSIENSTLFYDFNNQTILNSSNPVSYYGLYQLSFFWFNGSAIGCKRIAIYIDYYDLDLYDLNYNSNLDKNILDGEIKHNVIDNFTLLVASVNETTGILRPDFYPINNNNLSERFNHWIGEEQLPVLIKSFKQSENILNPGELIYVDVSVQNLHPFINVNVRIDVKIVSLANEEWILTEGTASNVLLNSYDPPNDTHNFTVVLTMDQLWNGVNAPMRLAGAKTIVTVFIENNNTGTYEAAEYSLLSDKDETLFEGHILGLKITENMSSKSILYEFLREECIYLPNKTSIIVNIFDKNYISSYSQFDHEFSLQMNSKFTNITINPANPIKGQSFNVSAILSTEFGGKLINKSVSCDYYYNTSWSNIESDFTDSNGTIMFLINTLNIEFEGDLLIRLLWEGNNTNRVSKNISVPIIHESNNFSISIRNNDVQIYRNKDTTFTIILNNIGESILRITNISIKLNHNLKYSIVEIDYLPQSRLVSGESTKMIVEVEIANINTLEINISITAQNIITTENITVSNDLTADIYGPPVSDYLIEFFPVIMIVIFALISITTILYSKRIIIRIESPIEEPIKKRPRRGRYVRVSELKKSIPVKKMPMKEKTLKETEELKKTVDLDSLLDEKGLTDKKKKPKK